MEWAQRSLALQRLFDLCKQANPVTRRITH